MHEIHITASVDAPREIVFEHFADHEWFTGLFGASCERVVEGEEEPNGLGSVRRVGPGPLSFDETIIAFEPYARIDYKITRGGVIKEHFGELRFSDAGGQTAVDYRIRFVGKAPLIGGVVKWALENAWARNAERQLRAIAAG